MANDEWVTKSILDLQAGGGGGGTNNYNLLINKPKINGVELIGDVTPDTIGVVKKSTTSLSEVSVGRDANGLYLEY